MKISIKSETTKEIDFPVPSYWDDYGIKYMVTEDTIICAGNEVLILHSDKESHSYKHSINDLITRGKEISKTEFKNSYMATLSKFMNIEFNPLPKITEETENGSYQDEEDERRSSEVEELELYNQENL